MAPCAICPCPPSPSARRPIWAAPSAVSASRRPLLDPLELEGLAPDPTGQVPEVTAQLALRHAADQETSDLDVGGGFVEVLCSAVGCYDLHEGLRKRRGTSQVAAF